MPGCINHLKVLSVFAGIYRDTEKKTVVMETAGAEALSVFPSENPSRHIRISTAKKVRWDFVLCKAWWFPGASLPASGPGGNMAGPCSSFMRVHKITTTWPKQAVVAERLLGGTFPEEEPSLGIRNSISTVRILIFT